MLSSGCPKNFSQESSVKAVFCQSCPRSWLTKLCFKAVGPKLREEALGSGAARSWLRTLWFKASGPSFVRKPLGRVLVEDLLLDVVVAKFWRKVVEEGLGNKPLVVKENLSILLRITQNLTQHALSQCLPPPFSHMWL